MNDFVYSKKDHRVVTEFVGEGFLYDELIGQLDEERAKSLSECFEKTPLLLKKKKALDAAHRYAAEFGQMGISEELANQIRIPSTYLHVLKQKLKIEAWPAGVRLMVEGVLVSVASLVFISFVPWGKLVAFRNQLDKGAITLTEISRSNPNQDLDEGPEQQVAGDKKNSAQVAEALFEDETAKNQAPGGTQKSALPERVNPSSDGLPAKVATASRTTDKKTVSGESGANPSPGSGSRLETASSDAHGGEAKKQGFIYRGSMSVINLEATNPKLVELITQLGGRKAGEVELGWKKGSGRYFHFTLPESGFSELQNGLKMYGVLKIQKEGHPRVMPEGIIRLIITFDEKGGS